MKIEIKPTHREKNIGLDPAKAMLERATAGSAGYDVVSAQRFTIEPGQVMLFNTYLSLNMGDKNMVALLVGRSGLAIFHNIVLANDIGVIDSDYQGEICAYLRNLGDEPYTVQRGDRIAQLVFMPVLHPEMVHVKEFTETTERGEGGFGSTGK